jgi:hypothetical protein
MPADPQFERLIGRLRDLAMVEVEVFVAGAEGETLLAELRDDVAVTLREARLRMQEYARALAVDPLTLLDAPPATRGREEGRMAADRTAVRLRDRAEVARRLSRLDELVAVVYPRLLELDRRCLGAR